MFSFFWETDNFRDADTSKVLPALEQIIADYRLVVDYINVIFMDDEQLLEINRQFLQHDYYTDIITFNYADSGEKIEAELYISLDRVAENAHGLELKFEEELYRVVIHGVLHLAGLEDSTESLKKDMQLIENKYLKYICFT